MIRPIHPFPARMASELAIAELRMLQHPGVVLDPMAGSGTVLRQASALGHRAIGYDTDPLAVLMTRVWTTPVEDEVVEKMKATLLREAVSNRKSEVCLPWIDDDVETRLFIEYWFSEPQRSDLRRIADVLSRWKLKRQSKMERAAVDVLRLSLSRIIITKDQGVSLARDTSHSRPHKVAETSRIDVAETFERSVHHVRRHLRVTPPAEGVMVELGDARSLKRLNNKSIDIVLTSPPYLNAIDYMRGHRLALVWLGYRLDDLRKIRSESIGAERGPERLRSALLFDNIQEAMCSDVNLSNRHILMIARYAEDVYRMMSEIARVLRSNGRAILIVGNSCLKNTFIRNSAGVLQAGSMVGLRLIRQNERELPNQNRYLPMPHAASAPLGKRIRTETILTFSAA